LMVRNTTSLLAMVRAAVGITVLPSLAVDKNDGDLCFLAVDDPAAQRHIDILRRAQTSPLPAAQTFETAVRRVVADLGLAGSSLPSSG